MSRVAGFNAPEMKKFSIKEDMNDVNNSETEQNNIQEAFKINPKYSHFALLKSNNKIVTGWDYSTIDPAELREFKRDYFFNDLANNEIDPKNVAIYSKKKLVSMGIDPYDVNNWTNER
jgi:hypothetical protein